MTARTRWKKNGDCLCTDEELLDVLSTDERELAVWFLHPSFAGVVEAIEDVRRVCVQVLTARKRGNVAVERKALGPEQRWGRRGTGVGALEYVTRNVARKRDMPTLGEIGYTTRRGQARARLRRGIGPDPDRWFR